MQIAPPHLEEGLSLEAVIERRLAIVATMFGWSQDRISGFKEGFADFRSGSLSPARLQRYDADRHGFDENTLAAAIRDALGYRDGVATAKSILENDAYGCLPQDRDSVLYEVSLWRENGNGDFEIDDAEWVVNPTDTTDRFFSIMTPEAWRDWLIEEHRHSLEAGRSGYAHLVLEDIHDPVVYVDYGDGRIDVWDGWHRIAATAVKGAATIPSIRGVPMVSAPCP